MAKTLDKSNKRKLVKSKSKNVDKKQKTDQPESSTTPYSTSSSSSDSSDSEPEQQEEKFDPEELRELLQPYSKEQLVDLVCSASPQIGSSIYSAVLEAADRDVTHRKIFVYGLPWETTRDTLFGVFEVYGEIEECTVVIDKVTGKAKGFGFVTFKSRRGAREALKEPKKRILNRTATCQLAAMGPAGSGKGQEQTAPVKISLGGSQQQQQQVFNGVGGGMAASPFMLGGQYHPVYGGGMMGNPALAAAAAAAGGGGYMYPMLASALAHGGMGGIGDPGVGAGLSALGSYFRGQTLPTTAFSDELDRTGKRGSGNDSDAGGGSFNGYSNYS